MLQIENYIGGELVQPASGEYLDNFNPAIGEVYSLIPDSDNRDIHLAVEAARSPFRLGRKPRRKSVLRF